MLDEEAVSKTAPPSDKASQIHGTSEKKSLIRASDKQSAASERGGSNNGGVGSETRHAAQGQTDKVSEAAKSNKASSQGSAGGTLFTDVLIEKGWIVKPKDAGEEITEMRGNKAAKEAVRGSGLARVTQGRDANGAGKSSGVDSPLDKDKGPKAAVPARKSTHNPEKETEAKMAPSSGRAQDSANGVKPVYSPVKPWLPLNMNALEGDDKRRGKTTGEENGANVDGLAAKQLTARGKKGDAAVVPTGPRGNQKIIRPMENLTRAAKKWQRYFESV